jgi:hypothetical protein
MSLRRDRQGLVINGGKEAVEHYDAAIDDLVHLRPGVVSHVTAALDVDPSFAMGRVLSAYLGLLGTDEADSAKAAADLGTWLEHGDSWGLGDREKAHLEVARSWAAGDMLGAGGLLAELSITYPRDLLALAVGHQIDFFTGDAARLRDRVGGVLSSWSSEDAGWSQLNGMFAFGLEESGHYDRSEPVGLGAVEEDPFDVWAIHAVVHTYEMQGRFADGLRYLDQRVRQWGEGNFFNVHNWWHYGLFALEAGRPDIALGIYDGALHSEASEGVVMEMLDAVSLLWRLFLDGAGESERWSVLADAWAPKVVKAHYAFNDMHAVMAFVGSGRLSEARALVDDREAWLQSGEEARSNLIFTASVGLPVCQAILAFGEGRYGEVVDLLWPIRRRVHIFGGSHAQRDAVSRTLLEAAQRAGLDDLARTLVSERVSVKPNSPYNWLQLARLEARAGSADRAAAAGTRAADLRHGPPLSFAAAAR